MLSSKIAVFLKVVLTNKAWSQQQDENLSWRLMLGLGSVPAVLLFAGVLVLAESPRWLVKEGRLNEAALVIAKSSMDPEEVL